MPWDDEHIDTVLDRTRERILVELAQNERDLFALIKRQEALRATVAGLNSVLGYEEYEPKGAEAVEIVARDAIRRGDGVDVNSALTVSEIVEELRRRGWMPDSDKPQGAVRAAIRRLRDRDPRWGLYEGRLYYHDQPLPSESEDEEEEDA